MLENDIQVSSVSNDPSTVSWNSSGLTIWLVKTGVFNRTHVRSSNQRAQTTSIKVFRD